MKGARCVGARKERSSDKRGLPEAVLWGDPQDGMGAVRHDVSE